MALPEIKPVGAVGGPLRSGESFTIEGPPMMWETSAGTFIVDDDRATADGWRCELRETTVVWVKDVSGSDT